MGNGVKCLVAILATTLLAIAPARAQESKMNDDKTPRITLSASASTQARPDRAILRLGVATEKPTAPEARTVYDPAFAPTSMNRSSRRRK